MHSVSEVQPLLVPLQRRRDTPRTVDLNLRKPQKMTEALRYPRTLQLIDGLQTPTGFQKHCDRHAKRVVGRKQTPSRRHLFGIVIGQPPNECCGPIILTGRPIRSSDQPDLDTLIMTEY